MSIPAPDGPHKPKFLEEVRRALRLRHYSIRTEQTYLDWIRQFIVFHGKPRPIDVMGPPGQTWGGKRHAGDQPVPWARDYWLRYGGRPPEEDPS